MLHLGGNQLALLAAQGAHLGVPHEGDVFKFRQLLVINGRCAQLVAAMHEDDALGQPRKVDGIGRGGVAAADHHDGLPAEEAAVAGGAIRNAVPCELRLAGHAELARTGARGHDDASSAVGPVWRAQLLHRRCQVERGDLLVDDLHAEAFGLLLHGPCKLKAAGSFRKPRVVLDVLGLRELPTGRELLEHRGAQARARGVQARGQTRRACADDGDVEGFAAVRL